MKKYRILDSDDSDYDETDAYEDDDEEYHTISDFHNSDSGKDHLANRDSDTIHNCVWFCISQIFTAEII